MGSGCGSVGIVVVFYARCPQFENSHWQNSIHFFTINCIEMTKIKEKRGWEWPFKKMC